MTKRRIGVSLGWDEHNKYLFYTEESGWQSVKTRELAMEELLKIYSQIYHVQFPDRIGEGKDGEVFKTDRDSAVKFLHINEYFQREVRAYKVLNELGINRIAGLNFPKMVNCDDLLWAIEMTIVQPPFIVDFVSAYTDEEIEHLGFDDDVAAEREAFWIERFGDRWPRVSQIRDEFHRLTGLMLLDLSQNNIRFE